MIFKTLTIQNFLSIRNITLDLQDRGLVLIKGKNCDNPDLDNNGSGKSSMIEALVYALYGRTVRGLKGDAVVHKIPKKNTKVFLDLIDDNGDLYRIARYRKHKVNKNKSLLYRNGKEITPKSESDFNDYVADLLQADYLTFTSSLLYSAESFKFTSATDAEMKSTFDTMLGLDVFSHCLEITKNRLKIVEGELSTTEWKISDREEKIDSLNDKIVDAEKEKIQYEETLKSKQKDFEDSLVRLNEDLDAKQEELQELQDKLEKSEENKDRAQKKLDSSKKSLKSVEELKSELQDVKGEIKEHEQSIRRNNSSIEDCNDSIDEYTLKIEKSKQKIETLKVKKKNLDDDIGSPCPTCGQPMTSESIEPARKEYDVQIAEVEDTIKNLQDKIQKNNDSITKYKINTDELNAEISGLQDTVKEFQDILDKSKKLYDEKTECEEQLEKCQELYYKSKSDVKVKTSELTYLTDTIKKTLVDMDKFAQEKNPYEDIIKKYQSEQKTAQKEVEKFKESIQEKLDEKQCLQFWQQAYSNQGIKSFILDDITPFLNRRVNKYLNKLTSGHIEVKFSTQTTLKSGEVREKFSIDIVNQDGGDDYIANSGGEKKRIDLCINLALQDLVASRSTKRINIAIWDEVFDALDNTGIEKVIELLQELQKEKSTILVVSHNPHLQSYFTNVITVQKKDGYSTLIEGNGQEDIEDGEDED